MTPYQCPHCQADLRYDGDYSRAIGIEIRGVYDGALYWRCPYCQKSWHRWPEETWQHKAAKEFVGD